MSDQTAGLLSPWLRSQRMVVVKSYMHGKILDFGCGVGELTSYCGQDSYLGFDIDAESLEIAKRNHPGYRFSNDLLKERFDTIVLLAVLEHLKKPEDTLGELAPNLEDNGRIIVTTPHSMTRIIHSTGAHLGLFSKDACEDHEAFLDYADVCSIAAKAGLVVSKYMRFLYRMNQLFILERIKAKPE